MAVLNLGQRVPLFACRTQKAGDQLIEFEFTFVGVSLRSNIDTTALSKLNPPATRELSVCGADRVRMNGVATGQVARARQTLLHFQIVTDNAKNNLRNELLVKRNVTVLGEPEAHLAGDNT